MSTPHALGGLPGVARHLGTSAPVQRLARLAADRETTVDVTAPSGARPFLHAAVHPASGVVLAVTATNREADDLAAALADVLADSLGRYAVASFPSWETLPHERLSPRSDTVGRRLAVLRRLAHPDTTEGVAHPEDTEGAGTPDNTGSTDPSTAPLHIVVAPIRAVLQPIATGLGDLVPVALRAG